MRIREEYQCLLAKGQITASQGFELSRMNPENQDRLFKLIKAGRCSTYNELRAAATGLVEAENQGEMFTMPKPTEQERETLSRLERRIEQVCRILANGFKDGELVVAKKVDPHRAGTIAEELKLIQHHLSQMEKALRQTAAQAELVA